MATTTSQPAPQPAIAAKFVTGSTMRHIVVMTATATLGLMSIFIVDLANIFFLGLLNDVEITAAVGFASTTLFFATSLGIGLSIAASALVARAIGAGQGSSAARLATHAQIYTIAVSALFAVLMWLATPDILDALGATGRTHALAKQFLDITMLTVPALASGMCSSGVLRAVGDARRAMNITLYTGLMNAALDPLLILGMGLGITGAAIAMVIARLVMMGLGLFFVARHHNLIDFSLLRRPRLPLAMPDLAALNVIAMPAILTNLATPFSNAYVTAALAPFGEGTMAAWAVLGRVAPVALCGLFALSGAVGPVIGQNIGAGQFGRVRETFTNALIFVGLYTLVAWIVLGAAQSWLAVAFNANAEGAQLIAVYCLFVVPLFSFWGALFVANAAFNNLGRPHYATLFNWGRATLGTIPFTLLGALWAGAGGVVIGSMAGSALFGLGAVYVCYRLIAALGKAKPLDAG